MKLVIYADGRMTDTKDEKSNLLPSHPLPAHVSTMNTDKILLSSHPLLLIQEDYEVIMNEEIIIQEYYLSTTSFFIFNHISFEFSRFLLLLSPYP